MRTIYVQCVDGHWFSESTCPVDGSGSAFVHRVRRTLGEVGSDVASIDKLMDHGFTTTESNRVLIIESAAEVGHAVLLARTGT